MDGMILIALVCMFYTLQITGYLISKTKREETRKKNEELARRRKIISNDIEDQLAYLDFKDPIVDTKFNWKWSKVGSIVVIILFAIIIFRSYLWLFRDVFGIESVPLYIGILCLIIVPIIMNWLLSLFGLQSSDELKVLTRFRKRR